MGHSVFFLVGFKRIILFRSIFQEGFQGHPALPSPALPGLPHMSMSSHSGSLTRGDQRRAGEVGLPTPQTSLLFLRYPKQTPMPRIDEVGGVWVRLREEGGGFFGA